MTTLYFRREPTTDSTWIKYGPSKPLKKDLVIYHDEAGIKEKARIPWHQSQNRARKYVTLNCCRWKIEPVKK